MRAALVTVFLATASANAADVTATCRVEPLSVRLSESVHVILTVEGPAPIRVELAMEPLDEPSSLAWRLRFVEPPTVTALPDGRQRWVQSFRADPYQPGESLRLGLATLTVFAGSDPRPREVTVPPSDVRVTTSVADLTDVRSITGVESLPPITQSDTSVELVAVVVGVVALLIGGSAVVLRRLRPRPCEVPPGERARRAIELAESDWNAGRIAGSVLVDRLAQAIRSFVEARFDLPANRLTTAELLSAAGTVGTWEPDIAGTLGAFLEDCDRTKFAVRELKKQEGDALLAMARQLLAGWSVAPSS